MLIGTKELLRLVKEKNLVENLSERELTNPEGAGFDLRVAKIFALDGPGFLGIEKRGTPPTKLLADISRGDKEFILKPGEFVLTETMEKFNLPEDIGTIIKPRSTLWRSGVAFHSSVGAPGYSGTCVFAIHNVSKHDFKVELGARYCHIIFFRIEGGTHSTYRGQWKGGRVSTEGKLEKQV